MQTICSICLDEYSKSKQNIKYLKCLHCFHSECINKWTQTNKSCPLCRTTSINNLPKIKQMYSPTCEFFLENLFKFLFLFLALYLIWF